MPKADVPGKCELEVEDGGVVSRMFSREGGGFGRS